MSRHPNNSHFYPGKQTGSRKPKISHPDHMDFRQYCTIRQASQELGRSVSTIYNMIYDGRLPATESPSGLYIKLTDLCEALAKKQVERNEALETFKRRYARRTGKQASA